MLQVDGTNDIYVHKEFNYDCMSMTQYCNRTAAYVVSFWIYLFKENTQYSDFESVIVTKMANTSNRRDGFRLVWDGNSTAMFEVSSIYFVKSSLIYFNIPGIEHVQIK